MVNGILLVLAGAAAVVWAGWWAPRRLSQLVERAAEQATIENGARITERYARGMTLARRIFRVALGVAIAIVALGVLEIVGAT